jgi:transcriptional regulator with XRE-family HTH domain
LLEVFIAPVSDGERIKAARKAAGLTQAQLGEQMGVTQSVISDWENDRLLSWRQEADKLAVKLGKVKGYFAATANTPLETRGVQVVGEVQAGVFRAALEIPPEDRLVLPVLPVPGYASVELVALRVVGPSMDLLYPDGSYVIVASAYDTDVRDGDRVVVYRSQGMLREATIKEVRVEADGRVGLWPRSSHPDHQAPIYLDSDDQDSPEIAYVVVARYEEERRPPAPIQWRKKRTG